jgi:dihydrodiol dehydrogenase / D-xylose 1-dehydrogenase (NADP)
MKPTVVEKPLTLTLKDTQKLIKLANKQDVFLMEGLWTRCFPAMRKVRQLVTEGDIGRVSVIQADFGWSTDGCGAEDRIWQLASGGMTLDIGMYMVMLGQVGFPGLKASKIQSMGSFHNGVDHTVLANIRYGVNGFLQFHLTGDANTEERVVIQGTKGRIVIEPPAHVPTTIKLQKDHGRGLVKEKVFEFPLPDDACISWNYPGSIGFTHQVLAVGEALRNGERECRHFTHKDSLDVATVLDRILEQVHQHTRK